MSQSSLEHHQGHVWGGPQELSAWEALMWRSESDPRTRSTGLLLETLDGTPDWTRFVVAHERATRLIPRLRERVVEPHIPLVQPAWTLDVSFDLNHHVQRMRLEEPGTQRQLLDLCESVLKRPLDRARPPWESILVTGLEGNRSAYLFKVHHSLADGLGLMQLLDLAHSTSAEPSSLDLPDIPANRPVATATGLLSDRVSALLGAAPSAATRLGGAGLRTICRSLTSPSEVIEFSKSLRRMLAPPGAARSPLLANTGVPNRFLTVEASLPSLKASAKVAGGSVNDAYIAAILGGLRRYHELHDAVVDTIPMGMPVSIRNSEEEVGGNRFTGVRFAAPLGEPDPVTRIRAIRDIVHRLRDEPAIGFVDHVSPALTKLPSAAIIELSASMTTAVDLNISNIPGSPIPLYLAGQRVLAMYPLGPRPGIAIMAAMITYDGTCHIGMNVDAGVFADLDVLEMCMREGFNEVLTLGLPS
jgi:WS/DGAT/MGAT family acyltransferase